MYNIETQLHIYECILPKCMIILYKFQYLGDNCMTIVELSGLRDQNIHVYLVPFYNGLNSHRLERRPYTNIIF
jgi:hypothetical protein